MSFFYIFLLTKMETKHIYVNASSLAPLAALNPYFSRKQEENQLLKCIAANREILGKGEVNKKKKLVSAMRTMYPDMTKYSRLQREFTVGKYTVVIQGSATWDTPDAIIEGKERVSEAVWNSPEAPIYDMILLAAQAFLHQKDAILMESFRGKTRERRYDYGYLVEFLRTSLDTDEFEKSLDKIYQGMLE